MTDQRTRKMVSIAAGLAALLWVAAAWLPVAAAARPAPGWQGGDFEIASGRTEREFPALAYNSIDDEYLVVWKDGWHSPINGFYGQIVSAQGVPRGDSFVITSSPHAMLGPAVAFDSAARQYLVIWTDSRSDAYPDVYGQLVNADGTLAGSGDPAENQVIANGTGQQLARAVAYNSLADEYMVVWEAYTSQTDPELSDICARRVDADGALLGDTDPAACYPVSTAVGVQSFPALAYSPATDQYLVAWQDEREGDFLRDIYGQLLNADAGLPGGADPALNFAISIGEDNQNNPAVAYNGATHQYLVVWQDYRPADDAIYGQLVNADGTLGGDADPELNMLLSVGDGFDMSAPAVAYDRQHNQFLLTWTDRRNQEASSGDIYGLRLAGDGTPAAQGDFAIATDPNSASNGRVGYSPTSGLFLAVWQDYVQEDGGCANIYGQRVWWPGLLLGHPLGMSDGTSQMSPAVANDSREHHYLAVWADDQNGDLDIFGRLYDYDGQPLGAAFPIYEAAGEQLNPAVAYNATDRVFVVAWVNSEQDLTQVRRVTTQGTTPYDAVYEGVGGPGAAPPAVACPDDAADCLVAQEYVYGETNNICITEVGTHDSLLRQPLVVDNPATTAGRPAIAYHPSTGEYLVVWHGLESGVDRLYGQRVDTTPQLVGTPFIISAGPGNQRDASLAANPDTGEYLVAWQDGRSGTNWDLYAQGIDAATGTQTGSPVQIATSAPDANQVLPALLYAETMYRYRVLWQDDRNAGAGWDLRAQWLGGDGSNPGTADVSFVHKPLDQSNAAVAYSTGSTYNQALAVWEDRRSGSIDVYGDLGLLDNRPPVARFTRHPLYGRSGDLFTWNAWPSVDDLTPRGDLHVRWDLGADGSWDVGLSSEKVVSRTLTTPGVYNVKLEVWDSALLTDTVTLPVFVLPPAPPASSGQATLAAPLAGVPTATLAVTPTWAPAGTAFSADGRASAGTGTLLAAWDWEDGSRHAPDWQTPLTATHVYTVAGDYTVRLMVKDETGLTGAALRNVTVVPAAPVTLDVTPKMVTVEPHEVLHFKVTGWDTYGNVLYHPTVTWSLAGAAAGAIDVGGVYTAGLAAGVYPDVIRVQSGAAVATASVTVAWPQRLYLPLLVRKR